VTDAPGYHAGVALGTGRIGGSILSIAVAIVIVAGSIVPFLSSAWIGWEQDRAGSAALTGFDRAELRTVTDAIVADLVLGGDFGVALGGQPVLDAAERQHMRDVRGVFGALAVLAAVSIAVIAVPALRLRRAGPDVRGRAWRAVRRGAGSLAAVLGVLGLASIVAFDAAFELFHRLFFAPGTYAFDPRTSRLVQLFPESFWSETALVVGSVMLVVALVVAWMAGRRASRTATAAERSGTSASQPRADGEISPTAMEPARESRG
jgi:integral membrane protein (TIGR01906 family)